MALWMIAINIQSGEAKFSLQMQSSQTLQCLIGYCSSMLYLVLLQA